MASDSTSRPAPRSTPQSAPPSPTRQSVPSGVTTRPVGRFAPSPSGPLHRGSIVAALGSWLDARAAAGHWLLRIEDLDPPRERPGAAAMIARQLTALGLAWDGPILYQSRRDAAYAAALDRLAASGLIYACRCTRREAAHWPRSPATGEPIYPGTCRRLGLIEPRDWAAAAPRRLAIRWQLPDRPVSFVDRRLGLQTQQPATTAGDPVLRRADGLWAYQLAVVVDDGDSGITDVVRGEDLLAGTGRQILLQQALALPTPRYLHLPLVMAAEGRKLSKHEGAAAAGLSGPLATLAEAADVLGLDRSAPADDGRAGARIGEPGAGPAHTGHVESARCPAHSTHAAWLAAAVAQWRGRYPCP